MNKSNNGDKMMLKTNEKIILTFDEAIEALKKIEVILISLHRMDTYYVVR